MSCCKCILVNLDCMRTYINMDASVKEEHIRPHITNAHEIELYELIGEDCVNELCAAKESDTLTTLQTQLIELLTPWLVHIIAIRALTIGRGFWTASGLVFSTPGNYTSADSQSINANRTHMSTVDYLRSDGEKYRRRIIDFLQENTTSFPCLPTICGCNDKLFIYSV